MFSSINFLFLLSLAITSWIILCYFKQLEDQRTQDINIEFNMEQAFQDQLATSCRDNYEIFLNFIYIFACIYALAKITHVTEDYIARTVSSKFHIKLKKLTHSKVEDLPESVEDQPCQQQDLLNRIDYLEDQNFQLESKLKEYRQQCKRGRGKAGDEGAPSPAIANQRNIFISNRHFHVNRQVYVHEAAGIKMDFSPDVVQEGDADELSHIWEKYLVLQKHSLKPTGQSQLLAAIEKPALNGVISESIRRMSPMVISTEELQNMQGLYQS